MPIIYPQDTMYLGDGGLGGDDFLGIKSILLTLPDFSISTKAACALETSYTDAIIAQTMLNPGAIFESEDASVEVKYAESQTGAKQKVMPAITAIKFKLNLNEDQKKQAKKLENKVFRVILCDMADKIKLIEDGSTYKGAKTLPIYVDMSMATVEKPGLTTIFIQFEDANEFETRAIVQPVSWSVSDLPSLTPITIVAGAIAANAFQLDSNYISPSINDKLGVAMTGAINGLLAANIKVTSALGVARVVTGAVASTTTAGRYAVAATASVATDTVQVIPTAAMPFISNIVTLAA